jgi:hypothetical protein
MATNYNCHKLKEIIESLLVIYLYYEYYHCHRFRIVQPDHKISLRQTIRECFRNP